MSGKAARDGKVVRDQPARRRWWIVVATVMLVVVGALMLSQSAMVDVDRLSEDEARAMALGHSAHATDETSEILALEIAGTLCLVCEEPVSVGDITLTLGGRHVHLHPGRHLQAWNAAKESFLAKLGRREALSREGEALGLSPAIGWLQFGIIYVVSGLLIGALGALVAVGRGLSPMPWFVVGLLANVVGLVTLMIRRRGTPPIAGDASGGWTKPLTTAAPARCPECAASVHPEARVCRDCGSELAPLTQAVPERT